MVYGKKVIDHFENPKNVGSFGSLDEAKKRLDIGTGLVGAPACGDVMKLQIKVESIYNTDKGNIYTSESSYDIGQDIVFDDKLGLEKIVSIGEGVIKDARFKAFGCGSAIASSSYVTELVKGKTLEDAMQIKNTDIVEELSLPPVKIHCSVLAEDAIKAAIADYRNKRKSKGI